MSNKIIGALPRGTTLQNGTYTIERALGQGATGITYLANMKQRLSGNLSEFSENVQVAIKEFYFKDECNRESTTQNVVIANTNYDAKVSQFKKSFIKEARRIAGLSHPNIVHVLGIFEENNTVYYVMQYIRGGSIKDLIENNGAMPAEKVLKYASQVASALEYMHGKNMCHYDLKPGNIMLSSDDNAMLIDFGIAKNYDNNGQETSTTPPGLTKGYAPMEQYSSVTEFSPKIDVYSLGATMYAMLLGTTPPEPVKWFQNGFTEKPDNIPNNIWSIVKKAMSMTAKERPTMRELQEMLQNPEAEDSQEQDSTIYVRDEHHPEPHVPDNHPDDGSKVIVIPTPPKDRKLKDILFWIMAAVLLIATAVGCYFLVNRAVAEGTETSTDSLAVKTIYDSHGQPVMTFTGTVVDGQPQGKGTLTYLKDQYIDKYEGTLVNGLREDSAAVLFFKNGDVYRGAFTKNNLSIGAYYVKESGEYFQGKFKNDSPWNGVWYDANNNVICRVDKGEEK